MSANDQFDDIAVLKTLAELHKNNMLHPSDRDALLEQLKSEWGRKAARDMLSGKEADFASSKSVLRKFSVAV